MKWFTNTNITFKPVISLVDKIVTEEQMIKKDPIIKSAIKPPIDLIPLTDE